MAMTTSDADLEYRRGLLPLSEHISTTILHATLAPASPCNYAMMLYMTRHYYIHRESARLAAERKCLFL